MDEAKEISEKRMIELSNEKGFGLPLMTKDYYVTLIIYLLRDVKGIYFKGGTALQKIFLDYSRLSEDADYTVMGNIESIREEIARAIMDSGFFVRMGKDKDVENFVRLIAFYTDFQGEEQSVFIDLNRRAKLLTEPEKHDIPHFYKGFIPGFSTNTLSADEMIAEKMAATVARNKPRDHFDMYKIIKKGMRINLDYAKEKCRLSGVEFDIIRMFNNAKKLKNRWDEDMVPLIAEEITFQEVMKVLARYFNLKEEKG